MLRKVSIGPAWPWGWRGQVRARRSDGWRVRSAMQLEPSSVSDAAVFTSNQEYRFVMFPRWNMEAPEFTSQTGRQCLFFPHAFL